VIEYRAAATSAVDFEKRTIEVIAMPYGEEAEVEHNGKMLREVFERGAFRDIDPGVAHITANRDHSYERTVGKIVELREGDSQAVAMAKISNTPLGDETLELSRDGVLGASIAFAAQRSGMEIRNGLRRVFRVALLDHIAFLPNHAYKGARVLAVRSADPLDEDEPKPNLESVLSIDGIADLMRGRFANQR
jgi:HK97 family phage prohead protease